MDTAIPAMPHRIPQVKKDLKGINGLAPAYLLDDFHYSEQIHNYDIRNKDLIRLPLAKTTKFQTSYKYNATKSWNTLPRNLFHDYSITSFKLKVKKYLNHLSLFPPL